MFNGTVSVDPQCGMHRLVNVIKGRLIEQHNHVYTRQTNQGAQADQNVSLPPLPNAQANEEA